MRITYDPETDMLGIVLGNTPYLESEEVVPGVVLDFDEDKRVIAIEIFNASKSTDLSHVDVAVAHLVKQKS